MHDRVEHDASSKSYQALLASIKTHGQKQPALGRQLAAGGDYEIELIYGARRLAAAMELGVELLVNVRKIDNRTALIEMDIENRVREDISPYERGVSYKRWLRSGDFKTQAEIAKALSVSEAQICRLLKYADLPAALVAAFRSPRDIREDWAAMLLSRCRDPDIRESMLRRARAVAASSGSVSPQDVFDTLVHDDRSKLIRARSRDEVVKDSGGRALFRIGFRAKAVHLIVPRNTLSPDALKALTEDLRMRLETDRVPGSGVRAAAS